MLRELEEAVQRKFHMPSDVSDTTGVVYDWESRLHISQVWDNVVCAMIWIIFNLIFSLLKPVRYCRGNMFKHEKPVFSTFPNTER